MIWHGIRSPVPEKEIKPMGMGALCASIQRCQPGQPETECQMYNSSEIRSDNHEWWPLTTALAYLCSWATLRCRNVPMHPQLARIRIRIQIPSPVVHTHTTSADEGKPTLATGGGEALGIPHTSYSTHKHPDADTLFMLGHCWSSSMMLYMVFF